jgi:hypothetical protein
MIVCPVCEHAQARGEECEVCGKLLGAAGVAAPVARLEGLETTALSPSGGAPPPPEAIPELEPTRHGAAPLVADSLPDLERTATAPVDVSPEALPDLERLDAAIPGDGPTPLPLEIVCRYCRTPAVPTDRLCARCGMRLPAIAPPAPRGDMAAAPRLCSCGLPVSGALCPACGARTSR